MAAISFISSSPKPLDVTAAVPIRTPLVTNGLSVSNGIVFLFVVIAIVLFLLVKQLSLYGLSNLLHYIPND